MEEESITKIIATVGPSSENRNSIKEMINHKVDMFRLNFSWGDYEWFSKVIKIIKEESELSNKYLPIIQDLSGPRVQEKDQHHFGGKENEKIITEKDKKDLEFGIGNNVDYIAMSFVGNKEDIIELRNLIKKQNGNQKIISKIERKKAFENLDEIMEYSDAIMIARGDLGNEFALEEIPFIQHQIIKRANNAKKMVIVATQMMLTMKENPNPSRAEVSDVAYSIIDGADAIMLSEETASGKYPIEAVSYMEKIAINAEKHRKIIKIV